MRNRGRTKRTSGPSEKQNQENSWLECQVDIGRRSWSLGWRLKVEADPEEQGGAKGAEQVLVWVSLNLTMHKASGSSQQQKCQLKSRWKMCAGHVQTLC